MRFSVDPKTGKIMLDLAPKPILRESGHESGHVDLDILQDIAKLIGKTIADELRGMFLALLTQSNYNIPVDSQKIEIDESVIDTLKQNLPDLKKGSEGSIAVEKTTEDNLVASRDKLKQLKGG